MTFFLAIFVIIAAIWVRRFFRRIEKMTCILHVCDNCQPDNLRCRLNEINKNSFVCEHMLRIKTEKTIIRTWCILNFQPAKKLCKDIELSWCRKRKGDATEITRSYKGGIVIP